jgi:hypothetical protein
MENTTLPASKLTKQQVKTYGPRFFSINGKRYRITVQARYDDSCGNGYNSFGLTATIDRQTKNGHWTDHAGGCCHNEIAKHFPELTPLIKWHLTSSNGPLHYVANTLYWIGLDNLEFARNCAVWPDATPEQITEQNLKARLPELLKEFRTTMESIGFIY